MELHDAAKIAMEQCAQVSEEDAVLVVTDTNKQHIGAVFLEAAQQYTQDAKMAIMAPASLDGEDPPYEIAQQMQEADVIFALTTWSMSHTAASKAAMMKGAKLLSMPAVTDDIVKTYVPVDYESMKGETLKLKDILTEGKTAHLTSPAGTDLTMDISGKKGMALFGVCPKGSLVNLPDGEALVSPISADGILVIDGSMPPDSPTQWGIIGKIQEPIVLMIEKGMIVDILGGEEAEVLKKVFADYPPEAKQIAELGIGTNPLAEVIGNVTVDEKVKGTVHVAFGNSASIGGSNIVPLHLDGVVLKPSLAIDGKTIL